MSRFPPGINLGIHLITLHSSRFTLTQTLGKSASQNLLNAHWATWITQNDFNEIASVGLNQVRIPIGYWALNPLPGDPYVQGQLEYLDQAIGWARQAGLKVILDVHGGKIKVPPQQRSLLTTAQLREVKMGSLNMADISSGIIRLTKLLASITLDEKDQSLGPKEIVLSKPWLLSRHSPTDMLQRQTLSRESSSSMNQLIGLLTWVQ